jgi:hypothetical protein
MPVATDSQIRANIKTILQDGSGDDTSVTTRWKLSVDPTEWLAVAKSTTDASVIDGWIITRTKRKSEQIGIGIHYEYEYHYTLWYLRSVRGGTANNNSEYAVNALLDAVAEQFEENPTLGFDIGGGDGVHSHSQLQIEDIDIVNDLVHVVQAALIVYITKQSN